MARPTSAATTVTVIGIFLLGIVLGRWSDHGGSSAIAAAPVAAKEDDLATLRADVARLKAVVPDQSHAMSDVAYHFTNLYFAGDAGNWPLAQFYADELRSHLRWAVRVIPVRKDRDGREVDLTGILTALEQSTLKDLSASVAAKDKAKFNVAYRAQMENCMACHRAASKEYIRLHVPERPDTGVVEFRPE